MAKIIFTYKGIETEINFNLNDKIEDLFKKYEIKIGKDISKLHFIYNENKIDDNKILNEIINEEDKRRNIMNILVNENNETIINDNIKKSKEIICPKCNENILIKIDDYKINLFNCKNNHQINNILLNIFESNIDISKIICYKCKIKDKSNTYNNEFYRCNTCKINLCPLCKSMHKNNHKIINYDNKNYICKIHNLNYIKYCKDCKLNICTLCSKEHKNHSTINYDNIILNKKDNQKEINKLKDYINKFYKNINDIIEILNKVKDNMNIYYNIYNNIINNYNCENINYELLYNINEFNKYNNIIIKDINEIINDNNINNKFNNILNIYKKMNYIDNNKINNKMSNNNENNNKMSNNNEYNKKIEYKFEKDPDNLKYKYDITNANDGGAGINDIFEVFISYKDNKEYIISPNYNNHNLDIFTLLDNKKIKSLNGHTKNIKSVRYFINNKDYNEYLISADNNKIVIIWDITNNYNIKYKINTKDDYIFSCILVFPHNNNDNFIITSSISESNDNDSSATKIYSLNYGNFIKYINGSNNIDVSYLLSWYNKKNNNYYIIQLTNKKIIINNLLEDELYSELINEPEADHYSGFIYNIDNNDYLCSSSENGYINIWDLYNKIIFKVISINNCCLYHIIQWNNKYIIVADFYNKCFKVINLENEKIKDIEKQHADGVKCIKKIYHPKYGESLLSADKDKTIKLWSIN